MPVTVDNQSLSIEDLGLHTIGQVLSHVQRVDRLVVNLLIDGQRPDLAQIGRIRSSLLGGRTLFIETASPGRMALDVLEEVEAGLEDAEQYKTEAAEFLQQNQVARAMEKLGLCLTSWQTAEESVRKTGQLLKIDLNALQVDGEPLIDVLESFNLQLRQIKSSLTDRDFVSLSDTLLYETSDTTRRWHAVLDALRAVIQN